MEARQLFAIDGLFCGGCARGLEDKLRRLDGVVGAGVHFVTASAFVRWLPGRCDRSAIAACIAGAGYRLVEQVSLQQTAKRLQRAGAGVTIRLAIAIFFGMWSMAAALVIYLQPSLEPETLRRIAIASGVLSIPVMGAAGPIFDMAVRSIRMRSPGIDSATAIGVAGAVVLSLGNLLRGRADVYFDAATMLIALRLIGQLVELRLRGNAVTLLGAIEALTPETARRENEADEIPVKTLAVGERVWIDAGDLVTVDGVVEDGTSAIDAAILTGEAAPRGIAIGDRVQAGSTNLERRIVVRLDRVAGDRDIDRMGGRIAIEVAARGEGVPPDEQMARWLVIATPILMAVGALLGLMQGSAIAAAERALSVAIVICPCALAVARPLAHLRGVARAARSGIRIRDPRAAEMLVTAKSMIFDKTGTLTSPDLHVAQVRARRGMNERDVLEAACAAETGVNHPIARAIIMACGEEVGSGGIRNDRGARGIWKGRAVVVSTADAVARDGLTWVAVTIENRLAGKIALASQIDPTAASTIRSLRRAGLHLACATGDTEDAARQAAGAVGFRAEEVTANCSPLDKAGITRRYPRPTVFVGDGVNDAAALAAADCGVVVNGAHRVATLSAGIILTHGTLDQLLVARALARRTATVVRNGIGLAVAYNAIAVPAALAGLLSPVGAAVAMTVSSLLVLTNAARA